MYDIYVYKNRHIYIYIYIYPPTHTHTHTYIYIYIYIYIYVRIKQYIRNYLKGIKVLKDIKWKEFLTDRRHQKLTIGITGKTKERKDLGEMIKTKGNQWIMIIRIPFTKNCFLKNREKTC